MGAPNTHSLQVLETFLEEHVLTDTGGYEEDQATRLSLSQPPARRVYERHEHELKRVFKFFTKREKSQQARSAPNG